MSEDNNWSDWAKRVLGDIEKLEKKAETIDTTIGTIKIEMAVLKTKAVFVGVIAAAIVSLIVGIATAVISKKLGG